MKRSLKAVIALCAWTFFVTVASLLPDTGHDIEIIPGQDKIIHVVFYMVMCFLLRYILEGSGRYGLFAAIVTTVLYGIILECIQGAFIEGRHFDYFDIIANIIGSLTGSCLFYLLLKKDHNG